MKLFKSGKYSKKKIKKKKITLIMYLYIFGVYFKI